MKTLLWSAMFVFVFAVVNVAADGVQLPLVFEPGENSVSVEGSVERGDRDVYILKGKAGQEIQVDISSPENNAVFQIFSPGKTESPQGAGFDDNAVKWAGSLPVSGEYQIMVGGTRGNASYKLVVHLLEGK
jgi:hypothetical protein